jgi:hypothetical protein
MIRHIVVVLTALSFGCGAGAARAQSGDLIVEKKAFELPSYTTVAGETINSVKIGWEAAGTLNADKSNAILITHYFRARATRSVSTQPLIRSPATGMRSSDPAKPSIPTSITCSPPTRL